jgi:hypothetical protein
MRDGEFGVWNENECNLALSTAKLYILLARRAPELKKRGVDLNTTSVRAMRAMLSDTRRLEQHGRGAMPPGGVSDRRAVGNDIQRCVLLLNHLADYSDPDVIDSELLRVTGELQKRLVRREATQ